MSVFILVFPLPSLEHSYDFTDQFLFLCVFNHAAIQQIFMTANNIPGIVLGLGDSVRYKTKPLPSSSTKRWKTHNQRNECVLAGGNHQLGKGLERRGEKWKLSLRSSNQRSECCAVACPLKMCGQSVPGQELFLFLFFLVKNVVRSFLTCEDRNY